MCDPSNNLVGEVCYGSILSLHWQIDLKSHTEAIWVLLPQNIDISKVASLFCDPKIFSVAAVSSVMGESKEIKARTSRYHPTVLGKLAYSVLHQIFPFDRGKLFHWHCCPPPATPILLNFSASLDVQAVPGRMNWQDRCTTSTTCEGKLNFILAGNAFQHLSFLLICFLTVQLSWY